MFPGETQCEACMTSVSYISIVERYCLADFGELKACTSTNFFLSLNNGNVSTVAFLDLSAFCTSDYHVLVHSLLTDLGFTDTVHQWFTYYLTGRTQYVSYLIIATLLLLYIQVFHMVQFLAL